MAATFTTMASHHTHRTRGFTTESQSQIKTIQLFNSELLIATLGFCLPVHQFMSLFLRDGLLEEWGNKKCEMRTLSTLLQQTERRQWIRQTNNETTVHGHPISLIIFTQHQRQTYLGQKSSVLTPKNLKQRTYSGWFINIISQHGHHVPLSSYHPARAEKKHRIWM